MQYSRNKFGVLEKLPTPCIDTGMGLERISAVIECTDDNFCIDIFRALIEKSQKITDDTEHKTAHRVIADHLRSASFLIADGVMPSNTGRGYVLRRIIRRAVRYVGMLGYEKPIFSQIFPVLEKYMAETYPELGHNKELIISTLNSEEESFHLTLKNGLAILEENIKNLKPGDTLPGEVAFTLYDTYGFPLDLTIDALKEKNIAVDEAGFLEKMAQQKAKARGAWVGSGVECIPEVLTKVFKESGKTEFVGYDADNLGAKIIAILDEDGNLHQSVTGSNKKLQIILDRTPFYAESGGQEGDHGTLTNENITLSVYDTKKTPNGIISHYCATLGDKRVSLGDSFIAQINSQRRAGLMRSHSATHLLHHALRNLLGTHVTQKGSLVADDRLRFDFSYMQSLTEEQISEIEKQVNIVIWSNLPVSTTIKSVDDAIKSGAVALFGEKYDKDVRVVCMGDSVELCGGTHVANTSSIGIFKIISEGSIARGVRRIEAIVHTAALLYIKQQESKFAEEVKNFEARLKAENKIKQQELFELYKIVAQNIKEKREVLSNNIQIIVKELPKVPQDVAKRLITENLEERSIRIFIIINQSKVFVSIAASSDILSILDMENIINICKKEAKTTIGSLRGNFAQVIFNDKNLIENCYQAIRTRLVEIK